MKSYKSSWSKWCEYLRSVGNENHYLEEMNEDEKERLILRFIMNCYEKGLKKSQVQVIITGIRQWFRFNLVDCCAFNSEFVKQGIQSTKLKPNELRQKAIEVKENGKIPFTVEMLKSMREEYFIDGLWKKSKVLVDKAAYLATAICLNFGVRVGPVSLKRWFSKC